MMIAALQSQVRSLRHQIANLPEDTYRATPGPSSGSIGQHVRHVLDHARALLGLRSEVGFTYDARVRGTRVETDPACAVDELVRLCVALEDLEDLPFERSIVLTLTTDPGRPATRVLTTVGREVAFVLQHTIHHCALIAVLLNRAGVAVPARFGYAPSTPIRG